VSQRFSREEFHALVWSKPLTHLAKDFRLSDVALHKICRKHDIPNPPLGWWAKHAAGHPVGRIPLPPQGPDVSDSVVIASGELRDEPGDIAEARERARVRLSACDAAMPAQTHPIVARAIAKLRSAKVAENGLVSIEGKDLIPLDVAPASIDRLELCLNRIVAAAHAQGFELSKKGDRVAFTDGMVDIPFAIKETVKRSKHAPTADELAAQERERKARERRFARYGRSYAPLSVFSRPWPEWDYDPTGQLSFEFDLHLGYSASPAVRRSFRDAKVQRLESLAPDIAVGLAVLAVAKKAHDRKVVEDQLRAEQEKALRIEARRRSHIEDRRGKALALVLERIERRDHLRDLVSRLSAELAEEPDARVAEFLRWSKETLARAEAAASASGLAELFKEERIFGDDDDRGFYPGAHGW
jgi:hypothetical protein